MTKSLAEAPQNPDSERAVLRIGLPASRDSSCSDRDDSC
jgi:hypothetical protein